MTKHKPLCAIGVAPYYLNNKQWAISTFTVVVNKDGDMLWRNTKVVALSSDLKEAETQAMCLAMRQEVPLYFNLKSGIPVSRFQLEYLDSCSLLDYLL